MARAYKAPEPFPQQAELSTLFLAGSSDMGRAEPWQRQVEPILATELGACQLLEPAQAVI